jgi:hypothetical protein
MLAAMMSTRRRLLCLLEIATVGLPFCAFKLLLGSVLVGEPGWAAAGWGLTGLGLLDAVLNLVSFSAVLVGRETPVGVCSFQEVVTRLRSKHQPWKELGLSLDAMLSFTLVALMIGMHLLPQLSASSVALSAGPAPATDNKSRVSVERGSIESQSEEDMEHDLPSDRRRRGRRARGRDGL